MKALAIILLGIGVAAFATDRWADPSQWLALSKPSVKVVDDMPPSDEISLVRLATADPKIQGPESSQLDRRNHLVAVAMPCEAALVRAPVSEYLRRMKLSVGEKVEVGQELVWFDDEEARHTSSRQRHEELALAQRIKGAEASHHIAQERLRRMETLVGTRTVTELDAIEAQTNFTITQTQIADLKAEIAAAGDERMRLTHLVQKHVCRAPINGVVTEVLRHPGEWLEMGDVIARLESTELQLKVHVTSDLLSDLNHYQAVTTIDGNDLLLERQATSPSIDAGGMRTVTFQAPPQISLRRSQVICIRLQPRDVSP